MEADDDIDVIEDIDVIDDMEVIEDIDDEDTAVDPVVLVAEDVDAGVAHELPPVPPLEEQAGSRTAPALSAPTRSSCLRERAGKSVM